MQLALKSTKIWIANEPVDFRRSINGLTALVAEELNGAIPTDSVFIFYNRARDKLKILGWHRNGYVLLYKRLEQGRFHAKIDADGYMALNL